MIIFGLDKVLTKLEELEKRINDETKQYNKRIKLIANLRYWKIDPIHLGDTVSHK